MVQYDSQGAPAPAQERPPARWPLAGVMLIDLAIIAAAILLLQALLGLALLAMRGRPAGGLDEAQVLRLIGAEGIFVALLAQNAVFVAVPIARVALLRREPLAAIGVRAERPLLLVAAGVGLGALVLCANIVIGLLFAGLGIRQNQAQQFPLFPGDLRGQALFMLAAAALAPLGEETLFRGYIFGAIRQTFRARRWGVPLAYVASALLFTVVHTLSATEGLISLLTAAFAMGLLLAWGMHRTGSLIPGMIAHAMNNGVVLAGLLFCINNPGVCQGL